MINYKQLKFKINYLKYKLNKSIIKIIIICYLLKKY